MAVVLGVGYSFFYFGTTSFTIGESQSNVQQDIRLAADFITRQVRYAAELEILDENDAIPETITNQDNYIFINDDGFIEFRNKDGSKIINHITTGGFELVFQPKAEGKILYFKINGVKQKYGIESEVMILNIVDTIAGVNNGAAIRYK